AIDLVWSAPERDVRITGDPSQLGHAILNIVSNAVDAVGAKGTVEIRLTGNGMAVVEVIDTGPGPSTGMAERIFEPFVTGKPEGVGLGLAVAKQIIEAHGGKIEWRRENETTRFRIEIPTHG